MSLDAMPEVSADSNEVIVTPDTTAEPGASSPRDAALAALAGLRNIGGDDEPDEAEAGAPPAKPAQPAKPPAEGEEEPEEGQAAEGQEEPPAAPLDPAEARKRERLELARKADQLAAQKRADSRAARLAAQRLDHARAIAQEAEQRARAAAAEGERLRAEREALDAERRSVAEAIKTGGIDALKAYGLDYMELTKQELERSSPDALAKRALAEAEALRQELAARDQRLKEQEANLARQRQIEAERLDREHRQARIVEVLAEPSCPYEHASLMSPTWQQREAEEVRSLVLEHYGRLPTLSEVARELDARAKRDIEHLESTRTRRRGATTGQATATPPATAAATAQTATRPTTRTLAQATGARASATRELTQEERRHAAIELLRTMS